MPKGIKIGELARAAGCQVQTVRYYERKGLIPAPVRSEGNYRLYGKEHVERLLFIRHCRSLNLTLDTVRLLLEFRDAPEENCGPVDALLDEHIGQVVERIAQLKSLETQLRKLRSQCRSAQKAKDCRILQGLTSPKDR